MYEVKLYDGPEDNEGTIIHHHRVNGLKVEGSIKQEINLIDAFDFVYYPDNPGYNMANPLKTLVSVRNTITNEFEFEGRILSPIEDMEESGLLKKAYVCEGEEGFLHDAPQRDLEFRGSVIELVTTILEYFNSQIEPYKRFEVGNITVTDPNDYVYLYLSAEKSTYDTIQEDLIDRLGGEIKVRKEKGVRYLDYLTRIGEHTDTEIKLSKNLLSFSKEVDPEDIITRITPKGIKIKSVDESNTDASQARLGIEEVNGGLPYIDNAKLIEEFGVRGKTVVWEDVAVQSNLYTKGKEYIDNQKVIMNKYKLTALDLSLIGIDLQSIKVGNGYPVKNELMNIDETLRVIKKDIDINRPETSSYVIGDKFKTLTDYQREANKQGVRVLELQNLTNRQSKLISSLDTQVNNVNEVVDTINIQIGEADIPGLKTSIVDLNTATTSLKKTVDNINIPGPVTKTTDGLMVSTDKVKLDGLQSYEEATELKSGLLSIEDKKKLNFITVLSKVNLDNLLERIEILENGNLKE